MSGEEVYSLRDEFASMSSGRKSELRLLVFYVFIILACAGWVTTMLFRAYWNEGIFYELRWMVTEVLNLEVAILPALVFGILFGLVALMTWDWYKRWHGCLLWAGIIAGAAVLLLFLDGAIILTLEWADPVVLGVLALAFAGTVGTVGYQGIRDGKPRRFPLVFPVMGVFLLAFLTVGWIDAQFNYQLPIVSSPDGVEFQSASYEGFKGGTELLIDTGASLLLMGAFAKFATYDMNKSVMILGPAASGKTWLLTGINYVKTEQAATNANVVVTDPQGPLTRMTSAFAARDFDHELLQMTAGTGSKYMWLNYPHGIFFRFQMELKSLDYPGEALRFIDVPQDVETLNMEDALLAAEEADSNKQIGEYLSEAVFYADAVVTLIPLDDFGDEIETPPYGMDEITQSRDRMPRSEYLGKYANLAAGYPEKDFIPVVTKADLAREDFLNETRHKSVLANHGAFRDFISDEVLKQSIYPLMGAINDDEVHPVYFAVDEDNPFTEQGNINPNLDVRDGKPVLRGSEELFSRIGE